MEYILVFFSRNSKKVTAWKDRYRQENNIQADFIERVYGDVNWIELSQQNQTAAFCVSR
jgi:hypothetical protein